MSLKNLEAWLLHEQLLIHELLDKTSVDPENITNLQYDWIKIVKSICSVIQLVNGIKSYYSVSFLLKDSPTICWAILLMWFLLDGQSVSGEGGVGLNSGSGARKYVCNQHGNIAAVNMAVRHISHTDLDIRSILKALKHWKKGDLAMKKLVQYVSQ